MSKPGPGVTLLTNENFVISPEMVDDDQSAAFNANADIQEGVSGRKGIDTLYENTSLDLVQNPREGSTPAPVSLNSGMYPHRRL
jgi:hypothetical protein